MLYVTAVRALFVVAEVLVNHEECSIMTFRAESAGFLQGFDCYYIFYGVFRRQIGTPAISIGKTQWTSYNINIDGK